MLNSLSNFLDKIDFEADNGCWEWTGCTNENGYGLITSKHFKERRVHRLAYIVLKGEIPNGLVIDHLCKNRICCNPDHLEVVTRGENVRRGVGGEVTGKLKKSQKFCKHGHEYTLENTRFTKEGWRECKKCNSIRHKKHYKKKVQGIC